MEVINKKVSGTKEVSRNGDFMVQLQKGCIKKNKYVILSREDNKAKIKTRVEFLDEKTIDYHSINLDQKIRCAIGVPKGGNVIVTPYSNRGYFFQKFYEKTIYYILIKLFGVQKNIVRVKRASYNDMETDVCRLNISSMSIIGVEPGDFIVIESISSKLRLRVLETTSRIELEMKERVHNGLIDKDCEKLLSINEIEGNMADLHSIHLDLDARNILKVNQCEPVFIRRSILHEIRKKLHQVSTPIVLTIITIIFSFQFFTNDLEKLIAAVLGIIIVSVLTLMGVKRL